jgi:hypothetical protein
MHGPTRIFGANLTPFSLKGSPPWSAWTPLDEISADAQWIWTSNNVLHDEIYCRLVVSHNPVNCRPAADRYWQDYSDVEAANFPAWEHYNGGRRRTVRA